MKCGTREVLAAASRSCVSNRAVRVAQTTILAAGVRHSPNQETNFPEVCSVLHHMPGKSVTRIHGSENELTLDYPRIETGSVTGR